jgi:hypothetical protein
MTNDQVNRIVEHFCQQLHVAIRLKGRRPRSARQTSRILGSILWL